MENLKIQSGRKESIMTSYRSARRPHSNGANDTQIQVRTMKLWHKEFSLSSFENEAFSLKNGFKPFKRKNCNQRIQRGRLKKAQWNP